MFYTVTPEGETMLRVRELSKETWTDFETILGANGGARGCWCMHWRLSIAEWMDGKGDGNKRAMRSLARRKPAPGVVLYRESEPVAWCSLGPRSAFPRLQRSPLLAKTDDDGACSIACIFVRRDRRGAGLLTPILDAVCGWAADANYPAVEAYPIEPHSGKRAGADTAMTGIASAFRKGGFEEVARPRRDRPVMRRALR